jgi:AraC family transcriptional regulator, regulatory protein of adaptative response / methylated-DNA-[protein]-cysteine methyltransferase
MRDTERWAAVLARDRRSNFFYGVETTRIYCRPSCPSRRPSVSSVTFFDSPADAEQAGFRPCLRCTPRGPEPRSHLVTDVCRFIDANIERRITLPELSEFAGLSPFHLQREFKSELGISPREYADTRSRQLMPDSRRTAETIRYATTSSVLGPMLVAETDRGICAVTFGEDLVGWLKQQFPEATLKPAELPEAVKALTLAMRGEAINVPLDIRATAFQHKIWQHLRAIPRGHTATYEEIAAAAGHPSAVRAAARACAANRIAVAIPCHRVIRKDGSLGGYRWGIDRKRRLLELES